MSVFDFDKSTLPFDMELRKLVECNIPRHTKQCLKYSILNVSGWLNTQVLAQWYSKGVSLFCASCLACCSHVTPCQASGYEGPLITAYSYNSVMALLDWVCRSVCDMSVRTLIF